MASQAPHHDLDGFEPWALTVLDAPDLEGFGGADFEEVGDSDAPHDEVAAVNWIKSPYIYTYAANGSVISQFRAPIRAIFWVRVGFYTSANASLGFTPIVKWTWTADPNTLLKTTFRGNPPTGTRYVNGYWWTVNSAGQPVTMYYNTTGW